MNQDKIDTEIMIRANKAKNAFLAGCLDSWAIILEENPEMKKTIIADMKELAASLKKSAGVIILENNESK